ncbi:hypothetical protein OPT61_g5980 [Boeremia exigua]|uniref:Uncharacterized protein n=1 Tax=Boeremia exigua TaxID=749465 RepID=A0ACC2I8B0_9PLEO|nr:hypothetical protein OPT61_g5980 [Boeremia exigua]
MLLSKQQPQGAMSSIKVLHPPTMTDYHSTKLFESLLSPPAVTVRIQVNFTPVSHGAYWSTNPFDMESLPAVPSPGVQISDCAHAELQAELKHNPARWEDDELDLRSTPSDNDSVSRSTTQSSDEINVFDVQHQSTLTPNTDQLDEVGRTNKLRPLAVSPNNTSPNKQPSPQDPSTHSDTQALNIKTRRLHHSAKSPQRDPRTLFGSRETHLPWVTKLSPNRFSMAVSPDTLARDAVPPKSIWDAEDDEFDRWPTPVEAREELDTMRRTATAKRSTFIKPNIPDSSVAEQIAEALITPMGDATRTASEQEQVLLELEDMDCGNPHGRDLHDRIIAPLRSHDYPVLPAHAPVRHMHVLDAKAYTSSTDAVVKAARPRLCDAVATVLAYTSPECLAAFMNPDVKVFEWRRLINCVMIRREGNEVVVGNYYNFGTTYQWGYLVRSVIDADGAWSETWGSVSQGTTPVDKERVLFQQFEAEGTDPNVQPENEELALYVGRQLANFLLGYEVWNYYKWWRYRVEWEADGKVTDAREKNRYPTGLTFD